MIAECGSGCDKLRQDLVDFTKPPVTDHEAFFLVPQNESLVEFLDRIVEQLRFIFRLDLGGDIRGDSLIAGENAVLVEDRYAGGLHPSETVRAGSLKDEGLEGLMRPQGPQMGLPFRSGDRGRHAQILAGLAVVPLRRDAGNLPHTLGHVDEAVFAVRLPETAAGNTGEILKPPAFVHHRRLRVIGLEKWTVQAIPPLVLGLRGLSAMAGKVPRLISESPIQV